MSDFTRASSPINPVKPSTTMKTTTASDFKVRQGDVMIHAIAAAPAGDRKKRQDGALAYGEVTGHKHAVADLTRAEVLECGDGLFMSVTDDGGVSIVHEEHGTVEVPRGDYRITIQREYSPEEVRSVMD